MRLGKTHISTLAVNLTLLGCAVLLLFWPVLAEGETFAFRDAGHYYFNLFQWCDGEWRDGRIPLWNPYENTGTPQLADASSSVFYPGKLLFAIPGLDYVQRLNLYVVLHVVLAGVGAFFAGRRLKLSVTGCGVAAASYALGGVVLTQTANVVFLVGAAWLPFAVAAIIRIRRQPRGGTLELAAVMALMVLGGDPQMAYHSVLIGLLAAICFSRRPARDSQSDDSHSQVSNRPLLRPWRRFGAFVSSPLTKCLMIAAALAVCMSAIQVIPSAIWSRGSSRASYEQPRSLYESVEYAAFAVGDKSTRDVDIPWATANGILGETQLGQHSDHIYQFSQPPWTVGELIWPNISGRMYPTHQRWANGLPGADRVWNPSIYGGVLVMILAMAALSFRRRYPDQRFLSWLGLLSLLASFGWFGLGWLVREVMHLSTGMSPADMKTGSPTGGVYWFMVVFLPLYSQFRYPAKWMVVTVLAIALLAGKAVSGRRFAGRVQWIGWVLGAVSLGGLFVTLLAAPAIRNAFNKTNSDPLFGPLDAQGALNDVRVAFIQVLTILACAIAGWLVFQRTLRFRNMFGSFLLALIVLDLALANRWIIATQPAALWQNENVLNLSLQQRVYRGNLYGWLPRSFAEEGSADRFREVVSWDRATLFPKHHMSHSVQMAESYGSIASADYDALLQAARESGVVRGDGVIELPPEMLDLLSVGTTITSEPQIWANLEELEETELGTVESAWIGTRPNPMPRAWLVDHVVRIEPPSSRRPSEMLRVSREALYQDDRWRDFRRTAIVEEDIGFESATAPSANRSKSQCAVVEYDPQSVQIEVSTDRATVLVLNDYYSADWQATLHARDQSQSIPVEVFRTNRVFRGVVIPPGDWVLEMNYRPTGFYVGGIVSLFAWAGWCFACMIFPERRKNRRRRTQAIHRQPTESPRSDS